MAWPDRHTSGAARLDLPAIAQLNFTAPDLERFPCLALAMAAIQTAGTAPTVLNAANEVAVAQFLARQIPFTAIPQIIETSLAELASGTAIETLTDLMAIDQQARDYAKHIIPAYRT